MTRRSHPLTASVPHYMRQCRAWFISDTHERHEQLVVPSDVDTVIHCGDEANPCDPSQNERGARKFFDWFSNLPMRRRIFVPGNHSTALWHGLIHTDEYPRIKFVLHERIDMHGGLLFGSPYTPSFSEQPWVFKRARNRMEQVWESAPPYADILVTHGPPKGILDTCWDMRKTNHVARVGCKSLANYVKAIKPRIHAFGHIHNEKDILNSAALVTPNTLFLNCAVTDRNYNVVNNGHIVDLIPEAPRSSLLSLFHPSSFYLPPSPCSTSHASTPSTCSATNCSTSH